MRLGYSGGSGCFQWLIEARCHETLGWAVVADHVWDRWSARPHRGASDHFAGYAGSRPVRVGNAAYRQVQLDICYGELLDSVYLYDRWARRSAMGSGNALCRWWNGRPRTGRRRMGIWETRHGLQHFLYSRLMCCRARPRDSDRPRALLPCAAGQVAGHTRPHLPAFMQSFGTRNRSLSCSAWGRPR